VRPLSTSVQARFVAHLKQRNVPENAHVFYLKWLRYYLDFCEKFHLPSRERRSLHGFLHKLQEKKQPHALQHQAHHSIALYYEVFSPDEQESSFRAPQKVLSVGSSVSGSAPSAQPTSRQCSNSTQARPSSRKSVERPKTVNSSRPQCSPVARGNSWKAEYVRLAEEIKLRHYSPKTLKIYTHWVRKYQTFTRSQDPKALTTEDVKRFRTSLAVDEKVSAATQNLAFNALLFFHRHVLKKEFGRVEGVVRAKRKPYIPVVLSRDEIEAILKHLGPPFDLVVRLLYGCRLRLFECLHLRIHCFNFDAEVLTRCTTAKAGRIGQSHCRRRCFPSFEPTSSP
jgi:hypothetical protein